MGQGSYCRPERDASYPLSALADQPSPAAMFVHASRYASGELVGS